MGWETVKHHLIGWPAMAIIRARMIVELSREKCRSRYSLPKLIGRSGRFWEDYGTVDLLEQEEK